MTPEARHLLMALHEPAGRDDAGLARLTEAEWNAVAALATRQRVGPLLLSRPGLPFPESTRATLRERAEATAYRSLQLQAALREIALQVAPSGIQLVVLKGMHMALAVYPSPTLREMGDIDVLVSQSDFAAVRDVAIACGYSERLAGVADHHAPPLIRGRIVLELHHHIDAREHRAPGSLADALDRIIPLPLAPNLAGLSPADLLVHSALHAVDGHTLESGLRSICDLQAILAMRGAELDAADIERCARQWRALPAVQLGLALTERFLGASGLQLATLTVSVPRSVSDTAMAYVFDTYRPTSRAAAQFADAGWKDRVALVFARIRHRGAGEPGGRALGLAKRHGSWLMRSLASWPTAEPEGQRRRREVRTWLEARE